MSITNIDIDKTFLKIDNIIMQMKKLFKKIINTLEDSFMKNHKCICCYKEIPDDIKFMLCKTCAKDLEPIDGNLCKKCGDKLNAGGTCINACDSRKYSFKTNVSIYYYTNSAGVVVKNLKYGMRRYLAKYIADIMAERKDVFENIDAILYVPMSKKRARERGFNQAKEVAVCLGEKFNKPVLDLLVKIKDTTHQAGGTQKDRLKNLKDSFGINETYADFVRDKNVLIIDDVFTTGSTLSECSKVVKKLKPKAVSTFTFAKTKFNLTANDDETIEIE